MNQTKDEKGYYTLDVNAEGLIHDLGYIITNGSENGMLQTINNKIIRSDILDNDTYELWIWLDENKKDEGKYIPCISTSANQQPRVWRDDGKRNRSDLPLSAGVRFGRKVLLAEL